MIRNDSMMDFEKVNYSLPISSWKILFHDIEVINIGDMNKMISQSGFRVKNLH